MSPDSYGYWWSRFLFERALALIYLAGFLTAVNQFVPLLGEHGLLPVSRFVRVVPFSSSPSLFYWFPTDGAFRTAAWAGVALSCLAISGLPQSLGSIAAGAMWATLWVLYLSFVNVGQTFYAFGWESLLVETGFFAIFLGGSHTSPGVALMWIYRWVLFRLMFGAGLIKLRGDPCWRDLTCLNYYFETQPIPNSLSWYFHWLPAGVHSAGVAFNHIAELGVPFFYFAPQPVAGLAGLVTMVFQGTLIVSGNLSWLNWLTLVLCIPTLDDRWFAWLPAAPRHSPHDIHRLVVYGVTAVAILLSINPVRNMLSPRQMMNFSFNPLHLVNTYGAFGSITRTRNEIVIEGTDDVTITDRTKWREYEFRGKPGDPTRAPPQIAPYHLRLDWLMWFAAMGPPSQSPWFSALIGRLLEGDRATLGLLRTNPFPAQPPRYVRARYYEYHFTTREERARTGAWWRRELIGEYFGPVMAR